MAPTEAEDPRDATPIAVPPIDVAPSATGLVDGEADDVTDAPESPSEGH